MDVSPPGSSVYGISQARILEWVAISSSRGSSQPRDRTHISCRWSAWDRQIFFLLTEPPGKASIRICPAKNIPLWHRIILGNYRQRRSSENKGEITLCKRNVHLPRKFPLVPLFPSLDQEEKDKPRSQGTHHPWRRQPEIHRTKLTLSTLLFLVTAPITSLPSLVFSWRGYLSQSFRSQLGSYSVLLGVSHVHVYS